MCDLYVAKCWHRPYGILKCETDSQSCSALPVVLSLIISTIEQLILQTSVLYQQMVYWPKKCLEQSLCRPSDGAQVFTLLFARVLPVNAEQISVSSLGSRSAILAIPSSDISLQFVTLKCLKPPCSAMIAN